MRRVALVLLVGLLIVGSTSARSLTPTVSGRVGYIQDGPDTFPHQPGDYSIPMPHVWVWEEMFSAPESTCTPADAQRCWDACRRWPVFGCLLVDATCEQDDRTKVKACTCRWVSSRQVA